MDVRNFYEKLLSEPNAEITEQEFSGWLVIIDDELYLLEENFPENYKEAMKIKISNRDIIYAVRHVIPPLGGGESFVFHRAKLTGILRVGRDPQITPTSLSIEGLGLKGTFPVDLTEANISAMKLRYEAALNYDFFKEMGDY
jgi:hypothetical protein